MLWGYDEQVVAVLALYGIWCGILDGLKDSTGEDAGL